MRPHHENTYDEKHINITRNKYVNWLQKHINNSIALLSMAQVVHAHHRIRNLRRSIRPRRHHRQSLPPRCLGFRRCLAFH